MFCPTCKDAVLSITERKGVEIDYCPQCRGVWLDRGELDKIIEKSAAFTESAPDQYHHQPHYKGQKRRKSFLEELFD